MEKRGDEVLIEFYHVRGAISLALVKVLLINVCKTGVLSVEKSLYTKNIPCRLAGVLLSSSSIAVCNERRIRFRFTADFATFLDTTIFTCGEVTVSFKR